MSVYGIGYSGDDAEKRWFMERRRARKQRSITKALTWRIFAFLFNIILLYIFTGEFLLAFNIALVAAFVNIITFYFHERAWGNISWGRKRFSSHLKQKRI